MVAAMPTTAKTVTATAGGTDNNQLKEAAKETAAVAAVAMAAVEMATAMAKTTAAASWGRL